MKVLHMLNSEGAHVFGKSSLSDTGKHFHFFLWIVRPVSDFCLGLLPTALVGNETYYAIVYLERFLGKFCQE